MNGDVARSDNGSESGLHDGELARALESYLSAAEAGRPVDPDRLAAEHPAIAGELRSCLEVLRLAGRVEEDPARRARSRGMRIAQRTRCSAISGSSARRGAAAWGWSTRPSRSRSTDGWR